MKVTLKAHKSLFDETKINEDELLKLAGTNAGICYMPENFSKLEGEVEEKKLKRARATLRSGHHSVFGHTTVEVIIEGIPKICAMLLNNLGEYTTSEKSARYTKMENVTPKELELYNKWKEIFIERINKVYPDKYNEKQVEKLAMENARYLLSVFTPTTMAYTTSVRQFNYIIDWCRKMYQTETSGFFKEVAYHMNELANALEEIVFVENLRDTKNLSFNLFDKNEEHFDEISPFFGHVYQTKYYGSLAQLAQAQRHRIIDYRAYFNGVAEIFYVPPILAGTNLTVEWINDCESVADRVPQATLVRILEMGTAENFLLKTKERECACAQLEIQNQTVLTHSRFENSALPQSLASKFEGYKKKVRCGFDDYQCASPCIWGIKSNERRI